MVPGPNVMLEGMADDDTAIAVGGTKSKMVVIINSDVDVIPWVDARVVLVKFRLYGEERCNTAPLTMALNSTLSG